MISVCPNLQYGGGEFDTIQLFQTNLPYESRRLHPEKTNLNLFNPFATTDNRIQLCWVSRPWWPEALMGQEVQHGD